MRIIAGTARGRRLESPSGWGTRPTLDRVRENLFNILMPRVAGAVFLDLFAGTGANGLEALSRGAARAVFAESDAAVLAVLRKNIALCGFGDRAVVSRATLPAGLAALAGPFDLIFADPPYAWGDHAALLEAGSAPGLVREGALFVLETARKTDPPEAAGRWTRYRRAEYGDTALNFYQAT
jgi:16S rRNA (guanine966-N2)-methyltransferase